MCLRVIREFEYNTLQMIVHFKTMVEYIDLNPSSSKNANRKDKYRIHLSKNGYSILLFDQFSLIILLAFFVSGDTDCFVFIKPRTNFVF